jgi:hypothetical protein
MLPVPERRAILLSAFALAFALAFTRPTFDHVHLLVTGMLLTSGRRAVSAALRAVGLGSERHFTTYLQVLNRAVWSPLRRSRMLLHLLITAFLAPDARAARIAHRWHARAALGPKIALQGRSHDAVRSQSGHVVRTVGMHWVCLSLLVPSPWGEREWALPVLTVPTRSPALSQKLGKPHRTIPQYAPVCASARPSGAPLVSDARTPARGG